MNAKVALFLEERRRAEIRQDWGVYRSITADLERVGHYDIAPLVPPPALIPDEPVRRRKPRCEHGRPPDRCVECDPDLLAT